VSLPIDTGPGGCGPTESTACRHADGRGLLEDDAAGHHRNAITNVAPSPSSSSSSSFCDTQIESTRKCCFGLSTSPAFWQETGNTGHAPTVKGGRLLTNNNDPRARSNCEGRSSHGNNNSARRVVLMRELCERARTPWHSKRRPSEDACPRENVIRLGAVLVAEKKSRVEIAGSRHAPMPENLCQ
jgi:hypothetical protein